LSVKDPTGASTSASVAINVVAAPSIEAVPKAWKDMKKVEKYLIGRTLFPATNFIDFEIENLSMYEVAIKVQDVSGANWLLVYVPGEGRDEINKSKNTVRIMLGGRYSKPGPKNVRRDLYEDLYNYLGVIFKKIEAIDLSGDYNLRRFTIFNQDDLISFVGKDNIYQPEIEIYFDDQAYRPVIHTKKDPLLISDTPSVRVELKTTAGLIWQKSRLLLDKDEYKAAEDGFGLVVVKPRKSVTSFDVNYGMYLINFETSRKIPFGEHKIIFETQNAYEQLITRECFVRVVSLPAQIVGQPMVFPNPFNPMQADEIKIQYKLTMQTNIEIVLFATDGSAVMKKRFSIGDEGANKGINTVSWDGKSSGGQNLPNGIYTGVIIDKDENRILEKFRLTIFR
ncbi:MAG: hypothetical protein KJ811_04035, partial [Candidatus Margulisbacteria bacterium]|nr:hypothetical protein [Candidatus Margulisiibacteriota bacterium]